MALRTKVNNNDMIRIKGKAQILIFDKDGKIKYQFEQKNLVTTVGKNKLLDIALGAVAKAANWYLGLIDNAGFVSINAADTAASHAGWVESSAYTEANRQTWTPDVASGGSVSNSASVATFTINATGVLKGFFMSSNNTKGGTTGTLFNGLTFASAVSVVNGDSIKITYTVSL